MLEMPLAASTLRHFQTHVYTRLFKSSSFMLWLQLDSRTISGNFGWLNPSNTLMSPGFSQPTSNPHTRPLSAHLITGMYIPAYFVLTIQGRRPFVLIGRNTICFVLCLYTHSPMPWFGNLFKYPVPYTDGILYKHSSYATQNSDGGWRWLLGLTKWPLYTCCWSIQLFTKSF